MTECLNTLTSLTLVVFLLTEDKQRCCYEQLSQILELSLKISLLLCDYEITGECPDYFVEIPILTCCQELDCAEFIPLPGNESGQTAASDQTGEIIFRCVGSASEGQPEEVVCERFNLLQPLII